MSNDLTTVQEPLWQSRLAGKTVLVAGGSGLVGGAVVIALAGDENWRASGGRVVALCRSLEKGRRRLAGLGDVVTIQRWRMGEPLDGVGAVDAVVHAAGCGYPGTYMSESATLFYEALVGCEQLLTYAQVVGAGRFVFISSGEVYGQAPRGKRFLEEEAGGGDPLSPRAAYPMIKLACESLCASFGRQWRLPTSIARLCHIYGPGMDQEDPRIAAQFSLAAAEGRDIVMKSRGEQLRALCFTVDAANGVLTILANGECGAAYNVADEASELTVRGLAERLAALGGSRVTFDLPSTTEAEAFNPMPQALFSTERLRALGWRPRVVLEKGLMEAIRWFQACPNQEHV